MATRPKRSRIRLGLLLLAMLLIAAEVAVRALDITAPPEVQTSRDNAFLWSEMYIAAENPLLSYRNRPLAEQSIAGVVYANDENGWRVPVEGGPAKTGTRPRVAFLGDSTTYGFGVDAEVALPAQVAVELGERVVPLNLGVSGYGTEQEVELYESVRDDLGNTEVVVLVLYPNDFSRAVFSWDAEGGYLYYDPTPLPPGLRRTLWSSALYRTAVSWTTRNSDSPEVYREDLPEMLARVGAALARLRDLVAEDKRDLLVVHLPFMGNLDPYAFDEHRAQLSRVCDELGIAELDLMPSFLAVRDASAARVAERRGEPLKPSVLKHFLSRYWVAPKDHHLNREGNALAARAIAAELMRLFDL